tara:strand:+ start:595 stop:756 length:162 start_codon:yes stop_codon:yes gene_type:complete
VRPKPKIRRIQESGSFLAYHESKDGKKYEASGITMQDAIDEWYQLFSKELGGG